MKFEFKKLNKLAIVLLLLIFFLVMLMFGVGNKYFNFVNRIELKENTENDIVLDNWELSTVFYDSDVENGKKPLDEINWVITDGEFDDDFYKVITVQINYKNNNAVTTYEPGELKISIPNLAYYNWDEEKNTIDNLYGSNLYGSLRVSANHSGQTNIYEWDLVYGYSPNSSIKVLEFTNANVIEAGTNFEGSIQIEYTLESHRETPEGLNDFCIHTYNKNLKANINEKIYGNDLIFNYSRTYTHKWTRGEFVLEKTAEQLKNLDNISLSVDDYYFVVYSFKSTGPSCSSSDYLTIGSDWNGQVIYDSFSEDVIVMDYHGNVIKPENNTYSIGDDFRTYTYDYSCSPINYNIRKVIVAYPKEKYNENNDNLIITNKADLYGTYDDKDEPEILASDDVQINLEEFEFVYTGAKYGLEKSINYNNGFYYQTIVGEKQDRYNSVKFSIIPSTVYTGEPLTVEVGDDILYATNKEQNYERLKDDEYFFSQIELSGYVRNNNQLYIEAFKYDCELWVRYANSTEYELYEKFKYTEKTWNFDAADKVVGWYVKVYDMVEGIYTMPLYSKINFIKKDIDKNGTLYNFAYLKVYQKDASGNLIMLNDVSEEEYSTFITKEEIAKYDKDNYGDYIQRSCVDVKWSYYEVEQPRHSISAKQSQYVNPFDIDGDKKEIIVDYSMNTMIYSTVDVDPNYIEQYDIKNAVTGFYIYDLVPKGMKVVSSIEEIKESLSVSGWYRGVYDTKGNSCNLRSHVADNIESVTITENYKNTGKTKIEIFVNFEENPLFFSDSHAEIQFYFSASIPFSSYEEYGNVWTNISYVEKMPNDEAVKYYNAVDDIYDLNENGLTTDQLSEDVVEYTISYLVASYQDVTTYVQTDKSNHSIGVVDASYSSDYEYKLRVRTGATDVTNLIIYTNLEEAQKTRKYWKGEFLGVDTTYAESKGYKIKTYYSEKIDAGTLAEDTSWKEYNDTVDKNKVKSLAFQYLDSSLNPAVLPANSLTYVLIKMRAPTDESLKTLAYNNCWTEWNAIDDFGNTIDFITGIKSNVVKVSLPNSVPYADIEVKLEKIWEDGSDILGLRPSSVKYYLIQNGNLDNAAEIVLSINDQDGSNKNKWSKLIEVPKYDEDGNIINYTVSEDVFNIGGDYQYISSIENYSITNSLSKKITITKKWIDNNNSYLTRPLNITVQLLRNDKEYKNVTVTGDYSNNEWTKEIEVPIYDDLGNEYVYSLKEDVLGDYISKYEEDTYTLVNTLSVEDKIIVSKKWMDNSNKYKTRPTSIVVKLKQNNIDYKEITLNGTTDLWVSDEITVPRYDRNGVKFVYTLEENVNIDGYGIIEYDQDNFTITNKLKQNGIIVVTKKWLDGNNMYDTRPKDLTITLLQNGKNYETLTLSGDSNIWTSSIEVPKYDDNQVAYEYTIKEANENIIAEYSDVIYGEDGLTVTNRLNKTKDLTIVKKWIDYDNEYKTRPKIININLLRNGSVYKELELSGDSNTWNINVLRVPVYDENGVKYNYTIEEKNDDKLKNYKKIVYDQTNLTITNELTEKPKVMLYFMVKNGYTVSKDSEIKFDEKGLNKALGKNNIDSSKEFVYKLELENIITGEKYDGKLSSQSTLEFPNLPYGTYRVVQEENEYFDFVKMVNMKEVTGVIFKGESLGCVIEFVPTGEDIIYGVNVINKITMPAENPPTDSRNILNLILFSAVIFAVLIKFLIKMKKEF